MREARQDHNRVGVDRWRLAACVIVLAAALTIPGCPGDIPADGQNGDGNGATDGQNNGGGPSDGQEPPPAPLVTITGTVLEFADPTVSIADAYVYVPIGSREGARASAAEDHTGADGTFELNDVPLADGQVVLRVDPPAGSSYESTTITVTLSASGDIAINQTICLKKPPAPDGEADPLLDPTGGI